MIRPISAIIPTLFILISTGEIKLAQAVDFQYEVTNPYAPNAEEFLISQTNLTKVMENYGGGQIITYYAPSVQTGQGVMLYKFNFDAPSSQIALKFRLASFNFGSSYGNISVLGSKNGSDYSTIASLPKPVGIDSFLLFNQNLASEFLGSNDLYLRVEMNVVGWGIMSQWLRHDTTDPLLTPIFSIAVNVVPEPSTIPLAGIAVGILFVADKTRRLGRRPRYDRVGPKRDIQD